MKKIKPDKIFDIKLYFQKAIDNFKKSEPKTISFSGTHKNSTPEIFDGQKDKLYCFSVVNIHQKKPGLAVTQKNINGRGFIFHV